MQRGQLYVDNLWNGEERRGTASALFLNLEERLTKQDQLLQELKELIKDHIRDEQDLTPIVKELVATWKAAAWLVSVVKWAGLIAGAITAMYTVLTMKGS